MSIQDFDEVDFSDEGEGSLAFMHLGRIHSRVVPIGLAVVGAGDLNLMVSVTDARRLGERLIAAPDEIAPDR
jgi:hypothetical protein